MKLFSRLKQYILIASRSKERTECEGNPPGGADSLQGQEVLVQGESGRQSPSDGVQGNMDPLYAHLVATGHLLLKSTFH